MKNNFSANKRKSFFRVFDESKTVKRSPMQRRGVSSIMAHSNPVRDSRCGVGLLRTLFLLASMPVGGAETLLVKLVRRLDRGRFAPDIAWLAPPGELGWVL